MTLVWLRVIKFVPLRSIKLEELNTDTESDKRIDLALGKSSGPHEGLRRVRLLSMEHEHSVAQLALQGDGVSVSLHESGLRSRGQPGWNRC